MRRRQQICLCWIVHWSEYNSFPLPRVQNVDQINRQSYHFGLLMSDDDHNSEKMTADLFVLNCSRSDLNIPVSHFHVCPRGIHRMWIKLIVRVTIFDCWCLTMTTILRRWQQCCLCWIVHWPECNGFPFLILKIRWIVYQNTWMNLLVEVMMFDDWCLTISPGIGRSWFTLIPQYKRMK